MVVTLFFIHDNMLVVPWR